MGSARMLDWSLSACDLLASLRCIRGVLTRCWVPLCRVHQFGHVHGGYGTAIVDRPLAKGTETKADSKGDAKSTSSGAGGAGAGAAAGDATKTAPSEGGTVKTLFINAAMDSDEQPWFFDFYV